MSDSNPIQDPIRRRILRVGGLAILGGCCGLTGPLARTAMATVPAASSPRAVTLHNIHTGERGTCVFANGGRYLADGLAKADRLLRDHRTGDVHAMAPELLDLLHDLALGLDVEPAFEIVSGYRSPRTNAALRRAGRGVARKSYHMQGMAADVRLVGVDLTRLHRQAVALGQGGVGLYSGPGFIHVDTGPVRTW